MYQANAHTMEADGPTTWTELQFPSVKAALNWANKLARPRWLYVSNGKKSEFFEYNLKRNRWFKELPRICQRGDA